MHKYQHDRVVSELPGRHEMDARRSALERSVSIRIKLILATTCLIAGAAHATTQNYDTEAAWAAHTALTSTLNFNSGYGQISHGPTYTESGVTFQAPRGVYSVYDIGYDATYHPDGYIDLEGSPMSMTFGPDITSVAFDFGGFYNDAVTLDLLLSNGDSYTIDSPSSGYAFFGVTSDVALTSITVLTTYDYPAFDNLSLGVAVSSVPEPSPLLLWELGSVFLLWLGAKGLKVAGA